MSGYERDFIVADERARRAIEQSGRLLDPWDELTGRGKLSMTMDEWMEADAIDLLDGPVCLGYGIDDALEWWQTP